MEVEVPGLINLVLATGALGVAAMGVVDGLKVWRWLALAGVQRLFSALRSVPWAKSGLLDPLLPALEAAYGRDARALVAARWLEGDPDLLRSTLNRGVRLGLRLLPAGKREQLLEDLGLEAESVAQLQRAYAAAEPEEGERSAVARAELLLRERIEAAVALAFDARRRELRFWASLVAVGLGVGAALWLGKSLLWGLVVGLTAVPLAPVAKDVAEGLAAAARALRAARGRGET